jgi:hypothetical protein
MANFRTTRNPTHCGVCGVWITSPSNHNKSAKHIRLLTELINQNRDRALAAQAVNIDDAQPLPAPAAGI